MRKEWRAATVWDYHNARSDPPFAFLSIADLPSEVDQIRKLQSKPRKTDPVGHGLNIFDHRTHTLMGAQNSMGPLTASGASSLKTLSMSAVHTQRSRGWREMSTELHNEDALDAFLTQYVMRRHSRRQTKSDLMEAGTLVA